MSTVAEKSILSAISLLEIRNSTLASLSEEAIFSHVAKVSQDDAAINGRKTVCLMILPFVEESLFAEINFISDISLVNYNI
jgi:hypothetical protein